MQQRATQEMMRLRRSTVEHPFASLKYHIFGHPRFLLRGLKGAQTEISLATMVYNLKRMLNVSGGSLRAALVLCPNHRIRSYREPETQKAMSGNPEHRSFKAASFVTDCHGLPRKFGYITPEFISLRVSSSRSWFRRLRRSIAAAPLLPPRTGHSAAIPNICSKLLRCQEQV